MYCNKLISNHAFVDSLMLVRTSLDNSYSSERPIMMKSAKIAILIRWHEVLVNVHTSETLIWDAYYNLHRVLYEKHTVNQEIVSKGPAAGGYVSHESWVLRTSHLYVQAPPPPFPSNPGDFRFWRTGMSPTLGQILVGNSPTLGQVLAGISPTAGTKLK